MTGERYVLTRFGWLLVFVATGCAVLFPPRTRITRQELSAWCSVQAFQMRQGRTLAQVDSLGKREHITVSESKGRLTCFTIGGP